MGSAACRQTDPLPTIVLGIAMRNKHNPARFSIHWGGGGGGGGGDPAADAATQYQFNERAARLGQQLNRYNIVSPYGTQTFSGQTLTERLSPGQQRLFRERQRADIELARGGRLQAQMSRRFIRRNRGRLNQLAMQELGAAEQRSQARQGTLEQLRTSLAQGFDPEAEYQRTGTADLADTGYADQSQQALGRAAVEEALFSRLQPQMERDRGALEARLAAQGVSPGTEAYQRDMDELRRASTDARFQAVLAGGQEQSRLAGLRESELNRRAGLRQQVLQEQLARRQVPLSELAALEGGG